jgi:hypothetical protein
LCSFGRKPFSNRIDDLTRPDAVADQIAQTVDRVWLLSVDVG